MTLRNSSLRQYGLHPYGAKVRVRRPAVWKNKRAQSAFKSLRRFYTAQASVNNVENMSQGIYRKKYS